MEKGRKMLIVEDQFVEVNVLKLEIIVPISCKGYTGKVQVRQILQDLLNCKKRTLVKLNGAVLPGKYICLLWLLFGFLCTGYGQALSGPETVSRYTVAQKRLLVTSTTVFLSKIAFLPENDSLMVIARDLYHLPFLTPYSEGLQNTTGFPGTALVNDSHIAEAKQLLQSLSGENRIRLLLDLGTWYLHQSGNHKVDLDAANQYIQESIRLSTVAADKNLHYEAICLEGKWQYQSGNLAASQTTFKNLIALSQQQKEDKWLARCYQHLGEVLPNKDSMKLVYLTRSRELYRSEQEKEREIEVLWQLASSTFYSSDNTPTIKFLEEILNFQKANRFQHSLYALNLLSLVQGAHRKFLESLQTAQAALTNHQWSGVTELSSIFTRRIGIAYQFLGKSEEALYWTWKGLENRRQKTHLFWYGNLLRATSFLSQQKRYEEALKLMDSIVRKHPPITLFEKMQLAANRGDCYAALNKAVLADTCYMAFLNFYKADPEPEKESVYGDVLLQNAEYYIKQGNVKKARLFMPASLEKLGPTDLWGHFVKYSLLYRIDSINGDYKSALHNYRLYRSYTDSLTSIEQRRQLDELNLKYAAAKKDQNIKLLTEHTKVQQATLKQQTLFQNFILGGTALLLVILALVFNQYRIKKLSSETVGKKNAALQHLLMEKERLLKEIHHRVKNNLQIVMSLLNSQAASLKDKAALSAIQESQNRVQAMALIHQKLYQAEGIARIPMHAYIEEVVSYLQDSYALSQQVRFKLDIERIELDVTLAVPLGLIINEAITNAYKYAFPGDRSGTVHLSLHHQSDTIYELTIEDDGVGLPVDYDPSQSRSLGLTLIHGFSAQLGGELQISSKAGLEISLIFTQDELVKAYA